MLIAALILQAVVPDPAVLPGFSNLPELRFVFTRRPGWEDTPIVGTAARRTPWTRQAFYRVVRGCGGRRLGTSGGGAYSIVVRAQDNRDNYRVAECVKASTASAFRVGVLGRSAYSGFDELPFQQLWNAPDGRTTIAGGVS